MKLLLVETHCLFRLSILRLVTLRSAMGLLCVILHVLLGRGLVLKMAVGRLACQCSTFLCLRLCTVIEVSLSARWQGRVRGLTAVGQHAIVLEDLLELQVELLLRGVCTGHLCCEGLLFDY